MLAANPALGRININIPNLIFFSTDIDIPILCH